MLDVLKKFNLTIVETHGFKVDFEKYNIVDFSCVGKTDIFHVTLRKVITAEEYLTALLKKGYGIFLDGKVYYEVSLIPEVMNNKKKNLEEYISRKVELSKMDRYKIQKYLTHPQNELFVRNAMQLYELNFDLDFIKRKLEGRVKNVEEFMLYLENNKKDIAS